MLNRMLVDLYKIRNRTLRACIRRLVVRCEDGESYSATLREIFKRYYRVEIGMYTHGNCFVPEAFDAFTRVGRYCSIGPGARAMTINHRMEFKSTHGFFFNATLGICPEHLDQFMPLVIGNDVWLGANSLILPHTGRIGDGAVIGAGAVVNKDVPPYAVVVGNPARVARFRFSQSVIDELLASRWWEKGIDDLDVGEFTKPYGCAAASRSGAGRDECVAVGDVKQQDI